MLSGGERSRFTSWTSPINKVRYYNLLAKYNSMLLRVNGPVINIRDFSTLIIGTLDRATLPIFQKPGKSFTDNSLYADVLSRFTLR